MKPVRVFMLCSAATCFFVLSCDMFNDAVIYSGHIASIARMISE
jgi:hypothetical protein